MAKTKKTIGDFEQTFFSKSWFSFSPYNVTIDSKGDLIAYMDVNNEGARIARVKPDKKRKSGISIEDIMHEDGWIVFDKNDELTVLGESTKSNTESEARHYNKDLKLEFSLNLNHLSGRNGYSSPLKLSDIVSLGNGIFRCLVEYKDTKEAVAVFSNGSDIKETALPKSSDYGQFLLFDINKKGTVNNCHKFGYGSAGFPTDLQVDKNNNSWLTSCNVNNDGIKIFNPKTKQFRFFSDGKRGVVDFCKGLSNLSIDPVKKYIALGNFANYGNYKEGITIFDPGGKKMAHLPERISTFQIRYVEDKIVIAAISGLGGPHVGDRALVRYEAKLR